MRPHSLAEVAALTVKGDSFDRALANFLDEFYSAPTATALAASPELLAPHFGELGRVEDAYLAATAEELARRFNPNSEAEFVAQTSQSAVSRVSKPADGESFCALRRTRVQPTWKSAIQQVGKPALRADSGPTSEFGLSCAFQNSI